jgi:hypothetical protein
MALRWYSLTAKRTLQGSICGLTADSAFPDLESELRNTSRNNNQKNKKPPKSACDSTPNEQYSVYGTGHLWASMVKKGFMEQGTSGSRL